jgi:hypothetical protein
MASLAGGCIRRTLPGLHGARCGSYGGLQLTAACNYLWLVIGRRGGKSFAMAIAAVFLACFRDWTPKLSPGERAVVLLVASDREQAKILIRYIKGIFESPLLRNLVQNATADTLELRGFVTIEVVTRSYRSVRGRSVCAALLDELAFWRDDDSANPDSEVLNAIRASMATFGDDGMVIAASSPYARRGVLWAAFKRYHAKDDPHNLVWQAPTRVMNPSVSQAFVDAEFERDPASAAAEYGADFRSDIQAFIDREIVDACIIPGRFELPPVKGVKYTAFCDLAGGGSDAMTLAIAHRHADMAIIDALREIKPPCSPEAVIIEFAELLKSYNLYKVQGDRYALGWPCERFRIHGIFYEQSARPKSELYQSFLPLLNSGKVELLDNAVLVAQLANLERLLAAAGIRSIIQVAQIIMMMFATVLLA